MQKWEYVVVSGSDPTVFNTQFKALGEECWELVAVCVQGGAHFAYFKRKIAGTPTEATT